MTVPWIGEDNSREAEGGRLLGLCGCPPAGCRVCRLVVFGTDAFRDSAAFGFPVLRAGMTAPSASLPSSVHRGSRLRLHGALRLAVVTAVSRLSWCLRLDMERTARLAMGPSRVGSANSTRSVRGSGTLHPLDREPLPRPLSRLLSFFPVDGPMLWLYAKWISISERRTCFAQRKQRSKSPNCRSFAALVPSAPAVGEMVKT